MELDSPFALFPGVPMVLFIALFLADLAILDGVRVCIVYGVVHLDLVGVGGHYVIDWGLGVGVGSNI